MSSGSFKTPSTPSGSFRSASVSSSSFRAASASSGSFRAVAGAGDQHERYRVLVVDDEPAMLLSIQSVLSDDVELMTCESAERALELLKANPFHVVISDFVLPEMNGNELFRRVRELPDYTSCLLITGSDSYEQPRDKERHYVLLKPFDPDRLITLVMQLGRVAQMKRAVQRLGSSVAGKTG